MSALAISVRQREKGSYLGAEAGHGAWCGEGGDLGRREYGHRDSEPVQWPGEVLECVFWRM